MKFQQRTETASATIRIFVFGSNLAGIHDAGSAKEAHKRHGAAKGVGSGRAGNSYAIPTKDHKLATLRLNQIELWVGKFLAYAAEHKELQFDVCAIGCEDEQFQPNEIAPMFKGHTTNVRLDRSFAHILQHL